MRLSSSFGALGHVLLVAFVLMTTRGALAEPPTPTQCSDAFEESQRLSKAGKLQGSLQQLVICAQPTCPPFLARECSASYEIISSRLPTVNLLARDAAERPVTETVVSMDGKPLVERIGGVAVPVDPGLHEFVFESSGFRATKVRIVVAEGQKNQLVVATLEPVPVVTEAIPQKKAAAAPQRTKGIPTASYVLGGIGLAGLATGTAFRIMGSSAYGDLESRCGHACPPGDVDPVRTKFTVSSIGFGVGAAALLAAGVVLVVGGDAEPKNDAATSGWSLRAAYTGREAVAFVGRSFN